MAVPLSYSFRNLWTRRLTTFLTASGMALVVFVFAAVLMLAEGLQKTLVATGSYDNVVVLRKGSTSEVDSGIEREKASVVETLPQIATDEKGGPLAAKEVVILITLTKKQGGTSNVTIRGIGENSLRLRPQIRLVQGRMPRFGVTEMVAGSSLAKRFRGLEVGEQPGRRPEGMEDRGHHGCRQHRVQLRDLGGWGAGHAVLQEAGLLLDYLQADGYRQVRCSKEAY